MIVIFIGVRVTSMSAVLIHSRSNSILIDLGADLELLYLFKVGVKSFINHRTATKVDQA